MSRTCAWPFLNQRSAQDADGRRRGCSLVPGKGWLLGWFPVRKGGVKGLGQTSSQAVGQPERRLWGSQFPSEVTNLRGPKASAARSRTGRMCCFHDPSVPGTGLLQRFLGPRTPSNLLCKVFLSARLWSQMGRQGQGTLVE